MFSTRLLMIFLYVTFVTNGNLVKKRGTFGEHVFPEIGHHFGPSHPGLLFPLPAPDPETSFFHSQPVLISKPLLIQKLYAAPSPSEIATAVAAAKEASANVMAAQDRVHAAKEDLLAQQKIAKHKEAQAALALQKTEAAAAVQRQQASAAANAVILAQQRLAHAKADVAEQQRIASHKEAIAANAIQRSATAAADEIKKTESTAAKIAAIQSSKATAILNHVKAVKDASLAAAATAVSAANGQHGINDGHPWVLPLKINHYDSWR